MRPDGYTDNINYYATDDGKFASSIELSEEGLFTWTDVDSGTQCNLTANLEDFSLSFAGDCPLDWQDPKFEVDAEAGVATLVYGPQGAVYYPQPTELEVDVRLFEIFLYAESGKEATVRMIDETLMTFTDYDTGI